MLVIHSEDDQIVPYADSGPLSAALLKNGKLLTYKDLPHGLCATHPEIVNADILAFIRGEPVGTAGFPESGNPSIYVELRRNGQPINPLPWLAPLNEKVSG